jgi:hypothetical protein
MAISKVTLNGTTLMDATSATATDEEIISGYTALTADGVMTTGTAEGSGIADGIIQKTISGSYTNSNVTKIEQSIFYLCTGLTAISFPNVTSVAYRGFNGCSNLVSASLPMVTALGNEAFHNCSSLENIDMPKLSAIPTNGFSKTKISAVFWPGKTAGQNSFLDCKSLSTAVVGTTIYAGTFNGCSVLASVDFTNDSGGIVNYCFSSAALLSTLVIRGTKIYKLDNINAFNGTPFADSGAGGTIYIKKVLYDHLGDGSALDYKSATNWSTIDGYGTITWVQLEGSQYENYYVDGTPIT